MYFAGLPSLRASKTWHCCDTVKFVCTAHIYSILRQLLYIIGLWVLQSIQLYPKSEREIAQGSQHDCTAINCTAINSCWLVTVLLVTSFDVSGSWSIVLVFCVQTNCLALETFGAWIWWLNVSNLILPRELFDMLDYDGGGTIGILAADFRCRWSTGKSWKIDTAKMMNVYQSDFHLWHPRNDTFQIYSCFVFSCLLLLIFRIHMVDLLIVHHHRSWSSSILVIL